MNAMSNVYRRSRSMVVHARNVRGVHVRTNYSISCQRSRPQQHAQSHILVRGSIKQSKAVGMEQTVASIPTDYIEPDRYMHKRTLCIITVSGTSIFNSKIGCSKTYLAYL